jgi:hypothetical protein
MDLLSWKLNRFKWNEVNFIRNTDCFRSPDVWNDSTNAWGHNPLKSARREFHKIRTAEPISSKSVATGSNRWPFLNLQCLKRISRRLGTQLCKKLSRNRKYCYYRRSVSCRFNDVAYDRYKKESIDTFSRIVFSETTNKLWRSDRGGFTLFSKDGESPGKLEYYNKNVICLTWLFRSMLFVSVNKTPLAVTSQRPLGVYYDYILHLREILCVAESLRTFQ